jgi:hypothetical protein
LGKVGGAADANSGNAKAAAEAPKTPSVSRRENRRGWGCVDMLRSLSQYDIASSSTHGGG